jgi:hypothetical protein
LSKTKSKEALSGLPIEKPAPDSQEEEDLASNIKRSRTCPTCGKNARIVSNYLGINAHCGTCRRHWPVANSALRPEVPSSLPRGLSKQTSVEPDWNKAFEGDS